MGELRRRGRIWWIRYYRNGQRHEESARTDKKQAAIDLLKIREGDVARGVPVTSRIGRPRFEEAAEDLRNDYRTNGKRSLEEVERRIALWLEPFFGGRRMPNVTTADVRAYIAKRHDQPRACCPEADVHAGGPGEQGAPPAAHPHAPGEQRADRVLRA